MTQSWLDLLCRMLPGVKNATAFLGEDVDKTFSWPVDAPQAPVVREAIEMAVRQGSTVASTTKEGLIIARTIGDGGGIGILLSADPRQRPVVEQLLDWGCSWIELLHQQPGQAEQTTDLLPLLSALKGKNLTEIYQSFVDGLATATGARRVSLAVEHTGALKIVASSYAPKFDHRRNLAVLMLAAMAESRDASQENDSSTQLPAGTAAGLLQAEIETDSVVNLPFQAPGFGGVVQLQRNVDFAPEEVKKLDNFVAVAARLLHLEYLRRRPFTGLFPRLKSVSTSGKPIYAVGLVAALFTIIVLFTVKSDHEVGARATIEGFTQQAIVAPFDGYIVQSSARAGDRVAESTLLAKMDDQDLELEHRRLTHERSELDRQYREALAERNRSESSILKAQLAQADAKVALLERKLSQAEIRAPMTGVLITGDLTRSIGAPVTRGDLLFELAPLDAYRVVVHVNESDIDEIQTAQPGLVTLTSHPDIRIEFIVEAISGVVHSRQDLGVVFETEGRLLEYHDFIRPGMEGYARISVGDRTWGWILFHDFVDWWRLLLWRFLP